jgi:hypothetical protein
MEMKFNEDDKQKFIEYINFVAKNAVFNGLNTTEIINYFKMLQHVQQTILPKINANILEIIKVTEINKEEPQVIKEEPKKKVK